MPCAVRLPLLICALLALASPARAQSSIVDVVFDGLPAGVQADALAAQLALKKGGTYDKTKEASDRAEITAVLQDLGYLDADVKTLDNFVPGGMRLTQVVKAHNLYAIEAVKATGMTKEAVQAILDELKVGKETVCTRDVCDHLSEAIAPKMGVNLLFLSVDRKLNANKKDVTLIFAK
jgi:outer membrane protein assembly factor BamA